MVPATCGSAGDPHWLPQFPRSGGVRQAAPGGAEPGAGHRVQALALRRQLGQRVRATTWAGPRMRQQGSGRGWEPSDARRFVIMDPGALHGQTSLWLESGDARIDRQPLWPVDFPDAEWLIWPALFPPTSPPAMGERAGWLAGAWASEHLSLTQPPFAAVAGPGVCGRSLAQ
jgi:hypothetical protein